MEEAKSTDCSIMNFCAEGRTEDPFFKIPLPRLKSIKRGVRENTRAVCRGRAKSIPAVMLFCERVVFGDGKSTDCTC